MHEETGKVQGNSKGLKGGQINNLGLPILLLKDFYRWVKE